MSRSVSNNAKASMLASTTNQVYLVLVTIDHTDLGSPIRLVNNTVDVVSNLETYTASAFAFSAPAEEDGSIKNAAIQFDNVDQSLVESVRSISSAPSVQCSIIRAAEPDVIEAGPWEFFLRHVNYDVQKISGDLIPDNPLRRYSSQSHYRNTTFPGLYG